MISNTFFFEQPCDDTRAIITSVKYDQYMQIFELELLGVGTDGFNFTNPGKAWMDDDDLQELMNTGELEFPQQLCGMQLMFYADTHRKTNDVSATPQLKPVSLDELLGDDEELIIEEGED